MVVVALAVVPTTIEAVHEVREADRARTGGKVVRRGRLLRQIVPVLGARTRTGDHAVRVARLPGFPRTGATARQRGAGWMGAGALLLLGGAFVALVARRVRRPRSCSASSAASASRSWSPSRRGRRDERGTALVGSRTPTGCAWRGPRRPARARCPARSRDEPSLDWTPSPLRWPDFSVLPVALAGALAVPLVRSAEPGRHACAGRAHADLVGTPSRQRSARHERDHLPRRLVRVPRRSRRGARRRPRSSTPATCCSSSARPGRGRARCSGRRTGSCRTRPVGGSRVTSSRSAAAPGTTIPASSPTSSGS